MSEAIHPSSDTPSAHVVLTYSRSASFIIQKHSRMSSRNPSNGVMGPTTVCSLLQKTLIKGLAIELETIHINVDVSPSTKIPTHPGGMLGENIHFKKCFSKQITFVTSYLAYKTFKKTSHNKFYFSTRHTLIPIKNIKVRFVYFKKLIHQIFSRNIISGPYSWFQDHPIAINGHRQSPVHILTKDVVKSEVLRGIPLR